MTDKQCTRCGEVNPAEIHTCTPQAQYSDIVSDGGLDPRRKFDVAPQREWQGLTDEEIISSPYCTNESDSEVIRLARDIEAKLKEKNG